MKTWFVKIDTNSIKKNPNAGSQVTHIPGPTEFRFKAENLPDYFIDEVNCYITNFAYTISDKGILVKNVEGIITSSELLDRIKHEKSKNVKLEINREVLEIKHFPEPDYFYDYEDTRVICEHCGSVIHVKDINDDCAYDEENEYLIQDICPECGKSDCVNLEYEPIDEALQRKNEKTINT